MRQSVRFGLFRGILFTLLGVVMAVGAQGQTPHTMPVIGQDGGACDAVAMQGRYAFICEGQALRVIDVLDPSAPKPLGQLVFNRVFHDLAVKRGYAYIALGPEGVVVVDVTNPLAPVRVGTIAFADSACLQVAVSGRYAYAATYNADTQMEVLHVVNVADPTQPREVGSWSVGIIYPPTDVCAFTRDGSQTWVLIANAEFPTLNVVDVTSPTEPFHAGIWGPPPPGESVSQCVVGPDHYLYIAGTSSVYIADTQGASWWQNTATPFATPATAGMFLSVQGSTLYASTNVQNSLAMMDISNPVAPVNMGSISIPEIPQGLAASMTPAGPVACVADRLSGLRVVDTSTPTSLVDVPYIGVMPKQTAYDISYWQPHLVSLSGSRACVIDSDKGLVIYDISDPAHPLIAGTVAANKAQMVSVVLDGNTAYVSEHAGGLHAIDITYPDAAQDVGTFATTPNNAGQAVVAEGFAYLATSAGLYVVNVQDPAAMSQVNHIGTTFVYSVASAGHYLFVDAMDASYDSYKYVYDISTPGTAVYVSETEPRANPFSNMFIANSRLYGSAESSHQVEIFAIDFDAGTLTYDSTLSSFGVSSPGGLGASGGEVFITEAGYPGVWVDNGLAVLSGISNSPIGLGLPERHVSSVVVEGEKCFTGGIDSGFTILGGALPPATVSTLPPFMHLPDRWIAVTGTAPAGALVSIDGGRFPVVQQLNPDHTSYIIRVPIWEDGANYLRVATLTDAGLVGTPAMRRVVEGGQYPTTDENVTSLTIIPTVAEVVLNESLQFSCMATFSDFSTADVTPYVQWRDVANDEEITPNGLYTNTRTGPSIIRASFGTLNSNNAVVADIPGGKATTGNVRATVQLMGTRTGSATAGTVKLNSNSDWSGTTTTLSPTVSVPIGTNQTSNTGSWNPTQGNYYFKAEATNYVTQFTNKLTLGSTLPSGYSPLAFIMISSTASAPVVQFVQPTSSTTTNKTSALPIKVVLASASSYLKTATYSVTKTVGATTTTVVSSRSITLPTNANSFLYSTTQTLGSSTTNGTVFTFSVTATSYSASNNTTTTTFTLTYTGTKSGAVEAKSLPPEAEDSDGDGLPDWMEDAITTSSILVDTDGDQLWDGDEYYLYGTDPTVPDTNGDGIPDGQDVANGRDPRVDKRVQMKVTAPGEGSAIRIGSEIRLVAEPVMGHARHIASVLFEMNGPDTGGWVSIGVATVSPYIGSLNTTLLTPGVYVFRAQATTLLGLVDPAPLLTTVTLAPLAPMQESTVLGVHELNIPVSDTMDNTIVFPLSRGAVLTLDIPAGAIESPGTVLTLRSPPSILSPLLTSLQKLTGIAFSASLANGQSVLNPPATMSIAYPDPDHNGALEGAPGPWLAIERVNVDILERLTALAANLVGASLTAVTNHLSTFALVIEEPESALSADTSGLLPDARLGAPYLFTLGASGGTPPYEWSQTVGELPPGLTLAGGTIVGTPASDPGVYHFGLIVSDSADPGAEESANYTIRVASNVTSLPTEISEPSVASTATGPVEFQITYTGATYITLDVDDIVLDTTGSVAAHLSVTGAGSQSRIITISNITGEGTFTVSVIEGTASNQDGVLAVAAGPSAVVTVTSPTLPMNVWRQLLAVAAIGVVCVVMRERRAKDTRIAR